MLTFQRGALSIVGVAPERFTGTGLPPQTPDIWIPASAQNLVMPGVDWIHDDGVREWQVLAREQPALRGQGAAELAVLSSQWPRQAGEPVKLSTVRATFFQTNGGAFGSFVEVCAVLMVSVILVLLIGCVNLTHLIAARNSGREQEIAVRLALGATRWRLVRQLCAESLVLGLIGGAAGLLVSYWTCNWLAAQSIELIRQITNGALGIAIDMSPDWQVFAFAAGISALTGIGVGILPAVRASNRDVNSTLKQGTAGAGGGPGTLRNRNLLLAFQVASCLILLAGAGLLFRGAARSEEIEAGFDYKHLAVVGVDTRGMAESASARVNLLRQALRRMEAVPGVVSLAWADRMPFLGTGNGIFQNEQGTALGCMFNGVSDEYFATVGIRLLTGRTFTREEIEKEPPIAVISESTAKRLWPEQGALGRRITPGATWLRGVVGHESFTVVGVVKSIRSTYLSKDDVGYVYIPRRLHGVGTLFLVRTRTLPDTSFKSLSVALAGVNQNLAARTFMSSMEEGPVRMQELMAQAPATVASIIGGLALLLACIGIYGVVSHFVARRTREIGIRMALGATRSDVIAAVSAQTLRPVAWGAGVGLVGAFGISGLLHTLIVVPDLPDLTYGGGAFDPFTFVCVLAMLAIVVLVAAFAPVMRATRVDAAVALRSE
jgi:putative ABC transport system permease protein